MTAVSEIERQIERLPAEEFARLAVWMWERVEEDGLLRACIEANEESDERSSREEIFALLEGR